MHDNRVLIQASEQDVPTVISIQDLEALWSNKVIITPQGKLNFDISWFIPEFLRFKGLLSEVLLLSLFLQLLALMLPLFFQVVMDKVLVHNALSTLDVLVMILLIVGIFEVIIKGLREYLFVHTTNRIDIHLGIDLFKHLLGLPIAYFKKRQVGTIVTRVADIATISAQGSVLSAEQASIKEQIDSLLVQKRREYYQQLNQVEIELAQIKQERIKEQERLRRQALRAPVDGVIQQLSIHTLGGVVTPAQALMVIVPAQAELETEVNVLNKDIGFVLAGQNVEIKVDSFPFTKYGTIHGELLYVSQDAVQDEQLGLVFPARVKLARSDILVDDKHVELGAGMSIVAEIKTGERRVIEYLLSPLQQYQAEALRER